LPRRPGTGKKHRKREHVQKTKALAHVVGEKKERDRLRTEEEKKSCCRHLHLGLHHAVRPCCSPSPAAHPPLLLTILLCSMLVRDCPIVREKKGRERKRRDRDMDADQ
jgi:hypothetical protein